MLLELAQDLGVDRIHGLLGQPAAETGKGGVIRSRLAEGQTQKGFEGEAGRFTPLNCFSKVAGRMKLLQRLPKNWSGKLDRKG